MQFYDYQNKQDLEDLVRELVEAPKKSRARIIVSAIDKNLIIAKISNSLHKTIEAAGAIGGPPLKKKVLGAWLLTNPGKARAIWFSILHFILEGRDQRDYRSAGGFGEQELQTFIDLCTNEGWTPDRAQLDRA